MNNSELDIINDENHFEDMEHVLVDENLSKYYSLANDKEKILLVGHSCERGGAELLLKNLIKEFIRQDVEVTVLVKADGLLREEYEKYAPTFIFDTYGKFEYYIKELNEYGYGCAILNTVLCADLIPLLHKWDYYAMNLIHELPGMIKLLNAYPYANMVANESDCTVFPSSYECWQKLFNFEHLS